MPQNRRGGQLGIEPSASNAATSFAHVAGLSRLSSVYSLHIATQCHSVSCPSISVLFRCFSLLFFAIHRIAAA